MDVLTELRGALVDLDVYGGEDLYLPVTGIGYLCTGQKCPDQTCHNDFEVQEGNCLDVLSLFVGQKQYLC